MTPRNPRAREDLVARGLPIVRRVARRVTRRIPPHVELADLVSAGTEGLLRAVDAYDPERARFEPYAESRIRGAILDELRAVDVMTQHGRRRLANLHRRVAELERELGRAPTDEEVAKGLGTSVQAYLELLGTAAHARGMTSGADPDPDVFASSAPDPAALYAGAEERHRLASAISSLPSRMQEVLGLYYQHECTQAEIGRLLDVTESRVCQILGEAVARLRFVLRERPRGVRPRTTMTAARAR